MAAVADAKPLFQNPGVRPMKVLVFGSESGTNAEALLRAQRVHKPPLFSVVGFVVNQPCRMEELGKEHGIPLISSYFEAFKKNPQAVQAAQKLAFEEQQVEGRGIADFAVRVSKFMRQNYYEEIIAKINDLIQKNGGFDAIVFAGWNSIVPSNFFKYCADQKIEILLNIHPADLTIEVDGKRKYTGIGWKCVQQALQDKAFMRTSVHIMTEEVDGGPLVVLGPVVPPMDFKDRIVTKEEAQAFQSQVLKPQSDWPAIVKAVEEIAKGNWGLGSEVIMMDQLFMDSPHARVAPSKEDEMSLQGVTLGLGLGF